MNLSKYDVAMRWQDYNRIFSYVASNKLNTAQGSSWSLVYLIYYQPIDIRGNESPRPHKRQDICRMGLENLKKSGEI